MKTFNVIVAFPLLLLALAACSRHENPTPGINTEAVAIAQVEARFLAKDEMPEIEVIKGGEDGIEIFVRLKNRAGKSLENWVSSDPGETPNLLESFYTPACNKEVLVLVLRQGVNTGASEGKYYFNALIDPATGDWITTFSAGEVWDKETSESISNKQKAVLAKLKAGITQHCPEILDPNNAESGKAREWLLR